MIAQALRLAGVAGRDGEPRHRADRGQRLAAKAERADLQQVVAGELGGGVALDRERRGRRGVMPAPSSVTRISRRPPPSVAISMRRRAGVERVLDQFLDDARRPLDHLAGGDAVDERSRRAGGWAWGEPDSSDRREFSGAVRPAARAPAPSCPRYSERRLALPQAP